MTIWDKTDQELSQELNKNSNTEIQRQTETLGRLLKIVGEAIGENKSVKVENIVREVVGKVAVERPDWIKELKQDTTPLLKKLDYIGGAIVRKEVVREVGLKRPDWIKDLIPKDIKFPEQKDFSKSTVDILGKVLKAIQDQEFPEFPKEIEIKEPKWLKFPDVEKPILALAKFLKGLQEKVFKVKVENDITVKNPVKEVTILNPQKEVKITNLKELEKDVKLMTSQLQALGQTGSNGGSSVDTSELATEAKQDEIIAKLPLNEIGRLKTSNLPADITPVTGTITGNAQTIAFSVDRVSNVMAHCNGTFSTINCTFEGSLNSTDGTDGNWFTIQAVRTNANTVETTTGNLSATPAYGWELSVNALRYVRVRSTAFTSGTQNWVFTLGSYATEPIPAIQTHAVTLAAGSTAIAKAEDSASASANVGVPPMVVRQDSLSANAGVSANGDYAFMFCDNDGRVYVTAKVTESALPTGASTEAGQYPAGTGSNGTVTLTDASTAYSVPATASTSNHVLTLYNGSDTDMFWGFATLTTGGILLPAGGTLTVNLGANQNLFVYCASAGKVINYSLKTT
jgi:hypothetical protein